MLQLVHPEREHREPKHEFDVAAPPLPLRCQEEVQVGQRVAAERGPKWHLARPEPLLHSYVPFAEPLAAKWP